MAGFRTSSNVPVSLPFEGMDLSVPIPLLPETRAVWIENFTIDGQTLRTRGGSDLFNTMAGLELPVDRTVALASYTFPDGSQTAFAYYESGFRTHNVESGAHVDSPGDFDANTNFMYYRGILILQDGNTGGIVPPRIYNGVSWASSGFVTLLGVPYDRKLVATTAHRNRLYFVENESLNLWYSPVDSISGTLQKFDMSSLFLGGGVLFGAYTISTFSNQTSSDSLAIISTLGEILIYGGSYPVSPDWQLIQRVQTGKLLSRNSVVLLDGDTILCTAIGIVSLRGLIEARGSNAEYNTISKPIDTYWRSLFSVVATPDSKIHSLYLPRTGSIYFNINYILERDNNKVNILLPISSNITFVYNTLNFTWSVLTYPNQANFCAAVLRGNYLSGSSNGRILRKEVATTFSDYVPQSGTTTSFTSTILSAPISLGGTQSIKKVSGITVYSYVGDTVAGDGNQIELLENFGTKKTEPSKPRFLPSNYNNLFYNIGSVAPYVQYILTYTTNSTAIEPTVIYSINALTESGGLR